MCPNLIITNGTVSISPPSRLLNSRTIYSCNEDHALKGDGNRICQEDSTWSGTAPECGKWFLCIYSELAIAATVYTYQCLRFQRIPVFIIIIAISGLFISLVSRLLPLFQYVNWKEPEDEPIFFVIIYVTVFYVLSGIVTDTSIINKS